MDMPSVTDLGSVGKGEARRGCEEAEGEPGPEA